VLACPAGHRFDVARQGHVVLVSGGTKLRSDTVDMVAARRRVLGSGAFGTVTAALVAAVGAGSARVVSARGAGTAAGIVVDLGAGTGAYTAAVLDALPTHLGIALELSTPALRVAARAHARLAAVGADLARPLPLADGAVGPSGVVVAVFAPLPTVHELRRTTAPGTRLVVVTPTPSHLAGLRERLRLLDVPAGKPDRLEARLAPDWRPDDRSQASTQVRLTRDRAADVVAMGPNAWHTDDPLRAALADLPDELTDTVAVTLSTFTRV